MRGCLPACVNSFFAAFIEPASVTIYMWDIRQGTERAGHIAIKADGEYLSLWADNTPEERADDAPAHMLIINSLKEDQLIVGHRIEAYTNGTRKNINDPNSVPIPSAPESLRIANGREDLKNLGKPDKIVTLNSLNTRTIGNYLRTLKNNSDTMLWDKKGVGRNKFNCATPVWEGLKRGGIKNLLPSYGKMFGVLGIVSYFMFPSLVSSWRLVFATFAAGGMLNAQKSINALNRLSNANQPNSLLTILQKAGLWAAATLVSGLASGATLGFFDDILTNIFITPDVVWQLATAAKETELSSFTQTAPTQRETSTTRTSPLSCSS